MKEFLAEANGVTRTWGVIVLGKSQTSDSLSYESVLNILQLRDAYPKSIWRIVAFGTDIVSPEEIAQFMNETNCVLVYDEHSVMSDILESVNPLISNSKLESVTDPHAYSRRKSQYRWEGELPETFVKTAVGYEFLQSRVAISKIFKLKDRRTLSRIEIVRLLNILSLGQTSVREEDFSSEWLQEDHTSSALSLITQMLQYDSSQNPMVAKISNMTEEISDLYLIWKTVLAQAGLETVFIADDTNEDGDPIEETSALFKEPVSSIADLIGIESYISAYYAGVPVSDIIV
jgi:hypothetical protein